MTLGELRADAIVQLKAAGCETPSLDADLLLAEATQLDRTRIVIEAQRAVDETTAAAFDRLLKRRVAREPVAYILGTKHFRNLMLTVTPAVLIPRPETELLVEAALDLPAGAAVLDVGTGSGAVALAVKEERPDLQVYASDIDEEALTVARKNARQLGLEIEFLESDLLRSIEGSFDLILSNPPYVAEADKDALPPELSYEPRHALFAGKDGLAAYRELIPALAGHCEQAALEIGEDQAVAVCELLTAAGFDEVEVLSDLAGKDRVVRGRLNGNQRDGQQTNAGEVQ